MNVSPEANYYADERAFKEALSQPQYHPYIPLQMVKWLPGGGVGFTTRNNVIHQPPILLYNDGEQLEFNFDE